MDPLLSIEALTALSTDDSVVVIDARRSRDAYLEGHLRGARWVDLDRDLAGPSAEPARGGRHPLPDPKSFARTLTSLGIGPDHPVVIYDDAGGALSAARFWWMLRSFGHARVFVLDGGTHAIDAAVLEGRLVREHGEPRAAASLGSYPERSWSGAMVSVDEVDQRRTDPAWLVLDVRAADRFRGDVEPLDPVAGHIAGAVNVPYVENVAADGRFLDAPSLRAKYEALLAERPTERLIVHCGSGVTACHTLLALERAGLQGAKLYVGSWSEWCRDPQREREPKTPR